MNDTSASSRNNALKRRTREYQRSHPGTTYTAARDAVRRDTPNPSGASSPNLSFLIGQPEAQAYLSELRGQSDWAATREQRGVRAATTPLRAALVGPPGTGKSLVARHVHDAYRAKGKFVETTAHELLGRYIGETSANVRSVLDKAQGGVLYIADIHDAAHDGHDSFRSELLTEMLHGLRENPELSVVVSTYASSWEEMSRLPHTAPLCFMLPRVVRFTTPTPDDLVEMLRRNVIGAGCRLSEDAVREVSGVMRALEPERVDVMGGMRRDACAGT